MACQVRTSPGAAYDLGYHVVWCPKYRRPVLGGRVKMLGRVHLVVRSHPKQSPSYVAGQFTGFTSHSHHLRAEFPHLSSRLPTLWSRSYVVATAGAVSAETVPRYIEMQDERAPKGGGRA
ncbi:transposase [Nonomuraea sp. K274]|uniref:Transposase n=1 Tax=Nonomuraea cypriaca TaxID=1187855 RepID=A0A931A7U1_9ACTN|nr:transposase [Nonomuraea cypriaca]MBF8186778.1 transposase [Nonomuraea cypriaca]